MKIDNNDKLAGLTGATDALNPAAATGPAAGGSNAATPLAQADQLTLSPEAQLLKAAVDTAAGDPAVRSDIVERMRALLEQGGVGDDASRLADAMIDDVLKNK